MTPEHDKVLRQGLRTGQPKGRKGRKYNQKPRKVRRVKRGIELITNEMAVESLESGVLLELIYSN